MKTEEKKQQLYRSIDKCQQKNGGRKKKQICDKLASFCPFLLRHAKTVSSKATAVGQHAKISTTCDRRGKKLNLSFNSTLP